MAVKLAVHQEHVIAFVLCSLDECILAVHICRIKEDCLLVLVSLLPFYRLLVVVDAEILAFCGLEKGELHRTLAEFLVREHAELDEELEIVPLLFELLTLVPEDLVKTVCDLLRDICRYLLYIGIALEVAS